MKILICSGFFESQLPSYREYAYSKQLVALGNEVTLMCGDQSQIWTKSRIKLEVTKPTEKDNDFIADSGARLVRRHVFFRYSDFVLFLPKISEIRKADIVHVLDFRMGITSIVAILAKLLGKPVVYDHEQRGDRKAKWFSRIDSYFRRLFIFLGSFTVSCMRHTVLANRDHYRANSIRRVREMFAPLGADPKQFYFDPAEREQGRKELGIGPNEKVAIVSGKLHEFKRIPDVIAACRTAGLRLILLGTMDAAVRRYVDTMAPGNEIILDSVDANGLRRLYNTADIAIFTTFTLSYWEALATGLFLVAPRTDFTVMALDKQDGITLFGEQDMFSIPDEQYRDDTDLTAKLTPVLSDIRLIEPREPNLTFSSPKQVQKLNELYKEIVPAD